MKHSCLSAVGPLFAISIGYMHAASKRHEKLVKEGFALSGLAAPANSEGGSLREPVLSRSVVQSSRMSLFFNQVNQKTESRPSWD
jgi:hypothetical protein